MPISETLSVSQAIRERRAIKEFDPQHEMSEADYESIMEHALLSPTAFNIQHWRYVRVTDPVIRSEIRKAAWDQSQMTDASLLLVQCMDLLAWNKQPKRYWPDAPPAIQKTILETLDTYYRDSPQTQRDEAFRSCGIAAMSIMLIAKERGYDSCPMDGFDFDRVAQLINLPMDHAICMIIAIGKKARAPWPRAGRLSAKEVIVTNSF